ncbi:hypothetical protein RHGRI_029436 [Rhododendron griersonianum]|uniref:Secreted protein n=1 Tax=Rhododendron griersonianum TaxID=479676 RepID=A0AAV6IMU8_9ERIC|nr:hypothetical protein RHGRI_029436 [Rhododendron griersonianum]
MALLCLPSLVIFISSPLIQSKEFNIGPATLMAMSQIMPQPNCIELISSQAAHGHVLSRVLRCHTQCACTNRILRSLYCVGPAGSMELKMAVYIYIE